MANTKAENVIKVCSVYNNKSVLRVIESVSVEQQLFTNHNGVSYKKLRILPYSVLTEVYCIQLSFEHTRVK